jgi:hypothetical protein
MGTMRHKEELCQRKDKNRRSILNREQSAICWETSGFYEFLRISAASLGPRVKSRIFGATFRESSVEVKTVLRGG